LLGFNTFESTVIAAIEWGSKMEIMSVPQAKKGS